MRWAWLHYRDVNIFVCNIHQTPAVGPTRKTGTGLRHTQYKARARTYLAGFVPIWPKPCASHSTEGLAHGLDLPVVVCACHMENAPLLSECPRPALALSKKFHTPTWLGWAYVLPEKCTRPSVERLSPISLYYFVVVLYKMFQVVP
jgi:hypothetical protein